MATPGQSSMADALPRAFTSSSGNVPSSWGWEAPTSRDGPNIVWLVRSSRRSLEGERITVHLAPRKPRTDRTPGAEMR